MTQRMYRFSKKQAGVIYRAVKEGKIKMPKEAIWTMYDLVNDGDQIDWTGETNREIQGYKSAIEAIFENNYKKAQEFINRQIGKDAARLYTDNELAKLEEAIKKEYSKAAKEMHAKQKAFLKDYEKEKVAREKALGTDKESIKAHKEWLRGQAARASWLDSMTNELSISANNANKKATAMLNDELPRLFSENANRAGCAIDRAVGANTQYTIMNEDAAREIIQAGIDNRPILREVKSAKDIRWNRQKFTSAITQGIIQGESIADIVKRTDSIYGMNQGAAIRAARTSVTTVENAGRMNSFERAQKLGIDLEIEWLATLDARTRDSHRKLDGEKIKLGEKFSNGLRYPGDLNGTGSELWNCRCRANSEVVGFDGKKGDWESSSNADRWSRLPDGITYDEWKSGVIKSESSGVVDGKDILGTWKRREDKFDFEIEDIINAQGFDGKPRIVSVEEFDKAVKEANGGNGFIAQRTYSAPSHETLNEYREQLYNGKWYVDCSIGGAQYGQGMYCAADYTGKVSDGIKSEMKHYIDLQRDRLSTVVAKSAIDTGEIAKRLGADVDNVQAVVDFLNGDFRAAQRFAKNQDMRVRIKDEIKEQLSELKKTATVPYNVETMTLDPSAKVISWEDAVKLQDEAIDRFIEQGLTPEQIRKVMPSDIGSFAASKGYDAINATGHGESGSYTVILNRTKLIIRRPK